MKKKQTRRTHVIPEYEGDPEPWEFICRRPNVDDKWAIKGSLPVESIEPAATLAAKGALGLSKLTEDELLSIIALSKVVCMRCTIVPKLIDGAPAEIPDGCLPIDEVPTQVLILLAGKILDSEGATRPTTATAPGSSSSTQSHAGTEGGPATS